jgi:surface antigen
MGKKVRIIKTRNLKNMIMSLLLVWTFLFGGGQVLRVSAEGYIPDDNPYVGGYGNCTWTAWNAAMEAGYKLPGWHNAGVWAIEAALQGYTVTDTPAKNSIVVWSNHVAFVHDVLANGNIYIEEGGSSIGHNFAEVPASGGLYGMPFIGYIYLPITEKPENYKSLPLRPMLDKAANVNIHIDTARIDEKQKELDKNDKVMKQLEKDSRLVHYVEKVEVDPAKSDEPKISDISQCFRLPDNQE